MNLLKEMNEQPEQRSLCTVEPIVEAPTAVDGGTELARLVSTAGARILM